MTITATFPALRNTVAKFRGYAYLANGWTRLRRWGGDWARRPDFTGGDQFQEVPYIGMVGPATEDGPAVNEGDWTPAPTESAADGFGWTVGVHLVRYRFKDSRTGQVSEPSVAAELTVSAASKKLTFPVTSPNSNPDRENIFRPTDPKADTIVLEATVADGGEDEFFLAGEGPVYSSNGNYTTSLVVEISDAELVQRPLPWSDEGQELPPVKRLVVAHRGRLWLFGDVIYTQGTITTTLGATTVTGSGTAWTEHALGTAAEPPKAGRRFLKASTPEFYEISAVNESAQTLELAVPFGAAVSGSQAYQIVSADQRVYFSRQDEPESFPAENFVELEGGIGGRLTAGVSHDDALLVFTERSTHRFTYDDNPKLGQAYEVPGNRGAVSQRVVVTHGGRVYSLDRQGVWVYSGGVATDVARPIERILQTELDWSLAADRWHACYLPKLRAIRWYVTRTGSSYPGFYLQLDLGRGAWTTGYEDASVTESHLGWLSASLPLQPLLGDARGSCWHADTGTQDGGELAQTTVAAGSPSAGVIATAADLSSAGDLRGVACTWLKSTGTTETQLVSHATTNAVVLVSPFSAIPTTGDGLRFGRIRARLRSKVFYSPRSGPKAKPQPQWLRFFYRPTAATRYVAVRVYEDWSSSAKTWSSRERSTSANLHYPGTVPGYAATDWLVDISDDSGVAEIQLGLGSCRCFEVELEVVEPDTELELWGLEVEGVEGEPL